MKEKKINKEQYIKLFCQEKRIRSRKAVYITSETQETLTEIVKMFAEEHTSISSLVEAIVCEHIKEHKVLINEIYQEERTDLIS